LVAALVLVLLALGGTGLVMNARYASSLGRSGEGETVLAVVGIAIDILALVLPSVGCALWSRGHRLRAVLAWGLWPLMVGFSLMATVGFSATHIGAAIAARSTEANKASDIQQWRKDRAAITERRTVEEIKIQIQRDQIKVDRTDRDAWRETNGCVNVMSDSAKKACGPILPTLQALAVAQHRDKLDRDISDAEKPQKGAPAATSADPDPQATQVSKLLAWVTRGRIAPTPDDIAVVRIFWSMMPSLAGLILMFVAPLAAPRTTSQSRAG
jgi:hypothetical protein